MSTNTKKSNAILDSPPSPPAAGSAATYEPNGYKFRDANNGEMMLVYEGEWKDWLAYRHPDGQWVSLRKATPADLHALGIAISEAHHTPNDKLTDSRP